MQNEKGAVYLWVLSTFSCLLVLLIGAIIFFQSQRLIQMNEIAQLQSKYYAEAGIWFTLEELMNQPPTHWKSQHTFNFPSGIAEVDVEIDSLQTQITLHATGKYKNLYENKISVNYDLKNNRIVHWQR